MCQVREDWIYVSMVIDRILLYVLLGVTLGGTMGILMSSPSVFEIINQKRQIIELAHKYNWGQDLIDGIESRLLDM